MVCITSFLCIFGAEMIYYKELTYLDLEIWDGVWLIFICVLNSFVLWRASCNRCCLSTRCFSFQPKLTQTSFYTICTSSLHFLFLSLFCSMYALASLFAFLSIFVSTDFSRVRVCLLTAVVMWHEFEVVALLFRLNSGCLWCTYGAFRSNEFHPISSVQLMGLWWPCCYRLKFKLWFRIREQ